MGYWEHGSVMCALKEQTVAVDAQLTMWIPLLLTSRICLLMLSFLQVSSFPKGAPGASSFGMSLMTVATSSLTSCRWYGHVMVGMMDTHGAEWPHAHSTGVPKHSRFPGAHSLQSHAREAHLRALSGLLHCVLAWNLHESCLPATWSGMVCRVAANSTALFPAVTSAANTSDWMCFAFLMLAHPQCVPDQLWLPPLHLHLFRLTSGRCWAGGLEDLANCSPRCLNRDLQ